LSQRLPPLLGNDRVPSLGLIAPALDGPPTGGTLYDAELLSALRVVGVQCAHFLLPAGRDAVARGAAGLVFVDSLYLDALPELRALARGCELYLLLHYLPSLVEHGREVSRDELRPIERDALDSADGFLVTSVFMQRVLQQLGVGSRPLLCVEPGVALPPKAASNHRETPRAVMLCNVVEGKGVLALLTALATRIAGSSGFDLQIAGRLDLEPHYAEACRTLIESNASLRASVKLLGPLPHREAIALLQSADVLVSSSRMESFGTALSEARAAGVPIIARAGGNVAAHVRAEAGGTLLADEAAVAMHLIELAGKRHVLAERQRRAGRAASARSWDRAAAELMAQLVSARAVGS
jgi:glycosyltransferase involved in cell wall biosynthesis